MQTRIEPQATPYLLTIQEDDMDWISQQTAAVWETKKSEIVLKGFRRGQVPQEHAESQIGFENLYEGVLEAVLRKGINEADTETPIVGVGETTVHRFEKGQPILLQTQVWLEPTAEVSEDQYTGLELSDIDVSVSDEEVEAQIQRAREGLATTADVDRAAAEGDEITIDFLGKLDGEPFQGGESKDFTLTIGSGTLIPSFESQLAGLSAGDEVSLDVTFPGDYPAANLAGKDSVFDITVKSVRERNLPEVDDDLAKQMGYSSLEEYRSTLRSDLETNRKQQADAQRENEVLQLLVTTIPLPPIPVQMINSQVQTAIRNTLQRTGMDLDQYKKATGLTDEQIQQQFGQTARTDVGVRLLMQAIADDQDLQASEEELSDAVASARKNYPDLNELSDDEFRQRIDMSVLERNVRIQKALDFVLDNSRVKKPKPQPQVEKQELASATSTDE